MNQNRPRSNDPRLNPREQQGQDSCMVVAVPVLVGIGLLMVRARDFVGDPGKRPDRNPTREQQKANQREISRRLEQQRRRDRGRN